VAKNLLILLLTLIISVCCLYLFFFFSFHFDIQLLKPINDNNRKSFSRNLFLRKILRLNESGDAKSDYYKSSPYSKLKFTVYANTKEHLYSSSEDLIKNYLPKIINKPGGIEIEDKPYKSIEGPVDESYLQDLSKNQPEYLPDTAILNIYILTSLSGKQAILGETAGAYSFVIFRQSLENGINFTADKEDLEKEVILHELGHLLGVKHLSGENCVMKAEVDTNDITSLAFTPTEYCRKDIQSIEDAN